MLANKSNYVSYRFNVICKYLDYQSYHITIRNKEITVRNEKENKAHIHRRGRRRPKTHCPAAGRRIGKMDPIGPVETARA